MPFTLAHPAAVLPLRKVWPGAFLALAVGSVAPDLPFFLPGEIKHALGDTHSVAGFLMIAPALGLALLVGIVMLAPALLQPLWGKHRALLSDLIAPFRQRSLRPWIRGLAALWIGSLSHCLCDAATHQHRDIVILLPILAAPLPGYFGISAPLFLLLQYATSLLGLVLLGWCYLRELRSMTLPPHEGPRSTAEAVWLMVIALAASALAARAVLRTIPYHPGAGGLLYASLTHFVSDFLVLYVVFGLITSTAFKSIKPTAGLSRPFRS